MARTQIYLGDEEIALLRAAQQSTGASRSELIRRAIRSSYGAPSIEARAMALRRTAGSWANERRSGKEYVDHVRGDLDKRLQRLGL